MKRLLGFLPSGRFRTEPARAPYAPGGLFWRASRTEAALFVADREGAIFRIVGGSLAAVRARAEKILCIASEGRLALLPYWLEEVNGERQA